MEETNTLIFRRADATPALADDVIVLGAGAAGRMCAAVAGQRGRRVRPGALEQVISSPAFHHWHHTKDDHRDHNFAFVFPFIDRLFGTAWLPKYWPSAYGINGRTPETLTDQLFAPLEARCPTGKPKVPAA